MKKRTRKYLIGCFLGLAAVTALVVCLPFLFILMFPVTSRIQYRTIDPHRASHHVIADTGIELTLWVKQRPRVISYEGDYRVLQVDRAGQAAEFYTLAPRFGGDRLGLQAFWLPARQVIRLVDVRKYFGGPQEAIVDVTKHGIIHVQREANGKVFASKAMRPRADLAFPPYSAKWSFERFDSSDPSERDLFPDGGEYGWVLFSCLEPDWIAPTGGVVVGMLEGADAQHNGQEAPEAKQ